MNENINFIRANDLKFTRDYMIVTLVDGRILQMPLDWFPTLRAATRPQLRNFEWIGEGMGIAWPDLDEHLSIEGFLRQTRGLEPRRVQAKSRPINNQPLRTSRKVKALA